jgi:hypothetical protein
MKFKIFYKSLTSILFITYIAASQLSFAEDHFCQKWQWKDSGYLIKSENLLNALKKVQDKKASNTAVRDKNLTVDEVKKEFDSLTVRTAQGFCEGNQTYDPNKLNT